MAGQIETDLIVKAIAEGFDRVAGDLHNVGGAARSAGEGVEESGKGAASAGLKWTELKSMVGLAQEAFGKAYQAAQKVYGFLKEGAELEAAEGRFGRLAEAIGTTSSALENQLSVAVRGMMTDAESMALAGDLMSLGLAKTSDETVRLTRVASALNMDMNQLTLTLANQTTMRFDSLGVSIDGFDERLNSLKATGMDVNEAFTEAFLEQAEAQILKVGDAADTTSGKLQILENRGKEAADSLRRDFLTAVTPIVDGLIESAEAQDTLEVAMARGLVTAKLSAEGQITYIESVRDGTRLTREQVSALVEATDATWGRQAAEDALRRSMSDGQSSRQEYIQQMVELSEVHREVAKQQEAGERAADDFTKALDRLRMGEGEGIVLKFSSDTEEAEAEVEDFITRLSGRALEISIAIRGQESVWDQLGIGTATEQKQRQQYKEAANANAEQFADEFNAVLQEKLTGEWTGDMSVSPTVDYDSIDTLEEKLGLIQTQTDDINITDIVPPVDQKPVEDLLTEIGKSQTAIDEFVAPTYRLETEDNLDELNVELNAALSLIRAIEGTHYYSFQQTGAGASGAPGAPGASGGGQGSHTPQTNAPVVNVYGTSPDEVIRRMQDRGLVQRTTLQ